MFWKKVTQTVGAQLWKAILKIFHLEWVVLVRLRHLRKSRHAQLILRLKVFGPHPVHALQLLQVHTLRLEKTFARQTHTILVSTTRRPFMVHVVLTPHGLRQEDLLLLAHLPRLQVLSLLLLPLLPPRQLFLLWFERAESKIKEFKFESRISVFLNCV